MGVDAHSCIRFGTGLSSPYALPPKTRDETPPEGDMLRFWRFAKKRSDEAIIRKSVPYLKRVDAENSTICMVWFTPGFIAFMVKITTLQVNDTT